MVRAGFDDGSLKIGDTVLEATGGNTGRGIAMAATILGLRAELVVPDTYTKSKTSMLVALGANVRLSNASEDLNANADLAKRLKKENADWKLLNQMGNNANPQVHRETTGPEILKDMAPKKIDFFVAGFGTGGHLTGVGESLKMAHPGLHIVAVEPEECDLKSGAYAFHKLQGLATAVTPKNLNTSIIDSIEKVSYAQAIGAISQFLRTEAIGIGPSSGAVLAVARRIAEGQSEAKNIVCMTYDSIDDYPEVLEEIGVRPPCI
jgi:cysteine synthase A